MDRFVAEPRPTGVARGIAERLAERDLAGALEFVHRADDSQLPLPGLRVYVEEVAKQPTE